MKNLTNHLGADVQCTEPVSKILRLFIPRALSSPQIAVIWINLLWVLCQKSQFWLPGREFECLIFWNSWVMVPVGASLLIASRHSCVSREPRRLHCHIDVGQSMFAWYVRTLVYLKHEKMSPQISPKRLNLSLHANPIFKWNLSLAIQIVW